MTLGSLQRTWRVAEPSVSKYKRRQSTNGVFSSELIADTEACLCEWVYVCASAAAEMFVISSTCCVVPGCRQANGLLQECEFRLVESEGLVHHMWRGFNIHLADRQRLSVFPAEQHLQDKQITCNLHKFWKAFLLNANRRTKSIEKIKGMFRVHNKINWQISTASATCCRLPQTVILTCLTVCKTELCVDQWYFRI